MNPSTTSKINAALKHAETELSRLSGSWSKPALIDEHVKQLMARASLDEYHTVPRELSKQLESASKEKPNLPLLWSRAFMLATMREHANTISAFNYPDSVRDLIERESGRILSTLEQANPDYVLGNDVYIKDLMCFTGRLVPCGMYVVDLYGGFPRSYLLKPNLLNALPNLWFVARAGGFRRYAQVHVHHPTIHEFSEAGRDRCFTCISDIMRRDSGLLGLMGSAWYYDPIVRAISPNLAYLSEGPANNGARFFNLGETQAARDNALARSNKRREHYAQGIYKPRQFVMLWPRVAFFEWIEARHKNR